ncbi:hypothetical protein B7494_g6391 [Chlorociboria aeruginascens]|nr:hypothetical protein B7494_g6391 [Chlorociboria aeruginascens]
MDQRPLICSPLSSYFHPCQRLLVDSYIRINTNKSEDDIEADSDSENNSDSTTTDQLSILKEGISDKAKGGTTPTAGQDPPHKDPPTLHEEIRPPPAEEAIDEPIKRGRGRPKGSKNIKRPEAILSKESCRWSPCYFRSL